MKLIYSVILITGIFLTLQNKQDKNYWTLAPKDGLKIYTIYFTTDSCYAYSYNNDLFLSTDQGSRWLPVKAYQINDIRSDKFICSGNIHCSAMKTTNGGINWIPCSPGMQEHFCCVYLKDPNSGYQPAIEFLQTVSRKVMDCIHSKETGELTNNPHQCTEYYSNQDEGWAVGWCLKDFMVSAQLSELK